MVNKFILSFSLAVIGRIKFKIRHYLILRAQQVEWALRRSSSSVFPGRFCSVGNGGYDFYEI